MGNAAEGFLAWEQQQTERHEFVRGEIRPRPGASDRHVTVAGNVGMALRLWVLHPFTRDEAVRIASVDLTLPAVQLWADVIEA